MWQDYLLYACFCIGLVAGGILFARSSTFWVGLGIVVIKRAWPFVLRYLAATLSPDNLKKLDATRRRAEEWDPFRKIPHEDRK